MNERKYIFVTGGVCSSLGKGIASASIGTLLESFGYKVSYRKFDGYLNLSCSTMNPEQHGEVYVAGSGESVVEADLDLGHYYRFTNYNIDNNTSITNGSVYMKVIQNDIDGVYDGDCVQIYPHISNEIKRRIYEGHGEDTDFVIIEVGGTTGDDESKIFCKVIKEIKMEQKNKTCCIHLVYIPKIQSAKEWKTKPAQNSVTVLNSMGVNPDLILCRIENKAPSKIQESVVNKISLFCCVEKENIFLMDDCKTVYEVPAKHWNDLPKQILKVFDIDIENLTERNTQWLDKYNSINFKPENKIKIGIFGKYTKVQDSYKSILESLMISCYTIGVGLDIDFYSDVDEDEIEKEGIDGIIIPGGFGYRGVDNKEKAFLYSYYNSVPCLGLCLGFQTSLISFAKEICKLNAFHEEFKENAPTDKGEIDWLLVLMEEQKKITKRSGTLRLGEYRADILNTNTEFYRSYSKYGTGPNILRKDKDGEYVLEIHRHRYEFNNNYKEILEKHGVVFTASHKNKLMEAFEIIDPNTGTWVIGTQYHPEYKSKFLHPHPLFMSFVEKCNKNRNNIKRKLVNDR